MYRLLQEEERRQNLTLDLIPSENIVSADVREALGSVFTNKYSEGYPHKRYYPGNAICDEVEILGQALARKVFGLDESWHINMQPYSGSPANIAALMALAEFGDTIMGMRLDQGGHLTHGHAVNFSGRAFNVVSYGVNDRGFIDYGEVERLAREHQPKVIICGATAYSRTIDFKRFGAIAKSVHAYLLADISHIAGLVASGDHPSPFPYADVVMTTTHKTLRGPRGGLLLCRDALKAQIDKAVFPGVQGGPHNNETFAKAVALKEATTARFKTYQHHVVRNAAALAQALMQNNFAIVSGGTDTHLFLLDLRGTGITGTQAEQRLERAGIIANRNTVPGDTSPFYPSGVRMGTPALTTRGMKERAMKQVAELITDAIRERRPVAAIRNDVEALCRKFSL